MHAGVPSSVHPDGWFMIEKVEEMTGVEGPSVEILRSRVEQISFRMGEAARRSGRDAGAVTLVSVSKTFPVDLVKRAVAAGLSHFGENKVQDLAAKAEAMRKETALGEVDWHMIGHLQRNKAREVVEHASLFHGLDSLRLARAVDKRAEELGRVMPCLVQVNISKEASKSGVTAEEAEEVVRSAEQWPHLQLRGLMAIASPADDPEAVRPEFRAMRELFESLRRHAKDPDVWTVLSMGMSSDYEVAIEEGATLVRIGSAIFGSRGV